MHRFVRTAILVAAVGIVTGNPVAAQRPAPLTDSAKDARWATEKELESIAVVDRKVMIAMRDGIHIPADIYRPKDESQKYPIVWLRTPYNFNYWDVQNSVPRDMTTALTAVKHGYAYIEMQERGEFFAEGEWDVLGRTAYGWGRRSRLDDQAAVVEWKSGHHGMFVDSRVAIGSGGAGYSRLCVI